MVYQILYFGLFNTHLTIVNVKKHAANNRDVLGFLGSPTHHKTSPKVEGGADDFLDFLGCQNRAPYPSGRFSAISLLRPPSAQAVY